MKPTLKDKNSNAITNIVKHKIFAIFHLNDFLKGKKFNVMILAEKYRAICPINGGICIPGSSSKYSSYFVAKTISTRRPNTVANNEVT